jgi:gas vesicle protein
MAEHETDMAGYLGWFFLGAAVGAAAALLLAPRSGRETRDVLAGKGSDLASKARDLAADAQGRAGEWVDKGREAFEEKTQRLRSALEAGTQAMREGIREGMKGA